MSIKHAFERYGRIARVMPYLDSNGAVQFAEAKHTAISGASTDNTIVAAVASKRILPTSFWIVCAADVDVRFEDGAGGTALTGVMSFGKGLSAVTNDDGLFNPTTANTLLNMELGAAVQVSGAMTYYEIE